MILLTVIVPIVLPIGIPLKLPLRLISTYRETYTRLRTDSFTERMLPPCDGSACANRFGFFFDNQIVRGLLVNFVYPVQGLRCRESVVPFFDYQIRRLHAGARGNWRCSCAGTCEVSKFNVQCIFFYTFLFLSRFPLPPRRKRFLNRDGLVPSTCFGMRSCFYVW